MFAKLANPAFLSDIRPLLPADSAAEITDQFAMEAFTEILSRIVELIPGEYWARVDEMRERFGIGV